MNCPRNTEQTEFSQGFMLNTEELEGTKDFLAYFFFRSFITNKAGHVSLFSGEHTLMAGSNMYRKLFD